MLGLFRRWWTMAALAGAAAGCGNDTVSADEGVDGSGTAESTDTGTMSTTDPTASSATMDESESSGDSTGVMPGCGNGVVEPGEYCFEPPATIAVPGSPIALAIDDVDGDGVVDVVTANEGSNSVGILLNDGDGELAVPTEMALAAGPPTGVTLADLDGDGIVDLAVAEGESDQVSLHAGNGDGTFTGVGVEAVETFPTTVAIGDFQGDGSNDLAVANLMDASVTVLLGDGDFGFAPVGPLSVAGLPRAVAIDDFDLDGNLDLVTEDVNLILGDGMGGFGSADTFPLGQSPAWVAVGRFNDDDRPDLAVAKGTDPAGVGILLGAATGFEPWLNQDTTDFPFRVAVTDLDSEGTLDLVTVNTCYLSCLNPTLRISTMLGAGDGSFAEYESLAVGMAQQSSSRLAIAVGDLNDDGVGDIVAANGYDNLLIVIRSDP